MFMEDVVSENANVKENEFIAYFHPFFFCFLILLQRNKYRELCIKSTKRNLKLFLHLKRSKREKDINNHYITFLVVSLSIVTSSFIVTISD